MILSWIWCCMNLVYNIIVLYNIIYSHELDQSIQSDTTKPRYFQDICIRQILPTVHHCDIKVPVQDGFSLQPLGDPWSVLDISSAAVSGRFSFASVP